MYASAPNPLEWPQARIDAMRWAASMHLQLSELRRSLMDAGAGALMQVRVMCALHMRAAPHCFLVLAWGSPSTTHWRTSHVTGSSSCTLSFCLRPMYVCFVGTCAGNLRRGAGGPG